MRRNKVDMMGHAKSRPVTAQQAAMSRRHISNHERVASIKDPVRRLQAAIGYDQDHASDHAISAENNLAELQHVQSQMPMGRRTLAPPQTKSSHVNGDFSQ